MNPVAAVLDDYLEAGRAFSRPARFYLAASFLVWFGRGVQSVLFNLYLVDAGFQEAFVGRALALTGLGVAITAIPAGLLTERWGRRRCLMLGIVVEVLGSLGRVCLVSPAAIRTTGVLVGAGMSLIAVAALPFMTEHSAPRERTYLFSAVLSCNLLALVAGSIAAGMLPPLLLATFAGTGLDPVVAARSVLVAAALCALTGWLPLAALRGLEERSIVRARADAASGSGRLLVPIGLNFLLIGCGAGLVVPFMNLYFNDRFSCSTAQIGVFFSVAAILTAFASLGAPALGRRFGVLRTALGFELLSLPFLITLGGESLLATAVVAFWMRTMLMNAGTPLLHSFVMGSLPAGLHARASSLMNLVWSSGWAASAAGAGVLIEKTGFATPFYLAAALYAAAVAVLYLTFRGRPKRRDAGVLPTTGIDA